MKIAVICGMQDYKVRARLKPIININAVDEIFLIRRRPIEMEKVKVISPPDWMCKILLMAELYRFLSLLWICITKNVQVLYAIYFVPHGIYAAIAGILFKRRVIQELIGTDKPKVIRSRLFLWLLKRSDWIGIRGTSSRKQLIEVGVPDSRMFSPIGVNALDFDVFKPEDCEKVYDLIYCGRMDKVKQIDVLIRSIGVLKEHHSSIRAVLIGDGPLLRKLQSLSEGLGLGSSVEFTGDLPAHRIPKYLNQSRIFVMTSLFEGLPVAMLEALSCGIPVVVPDVGDIKDVAVDGENACLITTPNVREVTEGLKKLLDDDDYYHMLAAGALRTRASFMEDYSQDKAKTVWQSVLFENQ